MIPIRPRGTSGGRGGGRRRGPALQEGERRGRPEPRTNQGARHMSPAERAANDRELAAATAPGYEPRGGRGRGGRGRGGRGGRGRGGRGRGGRGGRGRRQPRPNLPNDLNAPTSLLQYHRVMKEFMDHKKGRIHPSDTVFTE